MLSEHVVLRETSGLHLSFCICRLKHLYAYIDFLKVQILRLFHFLNRFIYSQRTVAITYVNIQRLEQPQQSVQAHHNIVIFSHDIITINSVEVLKQTLKA